MMCFLGSFNTLFISQSCSWVCHGAELPPAVSQGWEGRYPDPYPSCLLLPCPSSTQALLGTHCPLPRGADAASSLTLQVAWRDPQPRGMVTHNPLGISSLYILYYNNKMG